MKFYVGVGVLDNPSLVDVFFGTSRTPSPTNVNKEFGSYMKATGIVRRIDDLGRVVIPKEIRRTMRIREGDPSQITLTVFEQFFLSITKLYIRKNKLEEDRKKSEEIQRNFEKVVEYFKQQAKNK